MPQDWWSWATRSREEGIHGNSAAATTHLGTVTMKDSVEYLLNHNKPLRPTWGRVGKLRSWLANMPEKWALRIIVSSKLCVGVTRSLHEGPGLPRALWSQREQAAAYRHHKVSLRTAQSASEFPASKGCRRSIASRLTLAKLHLATFQEHFHCIVKPW